MRTKLHKLVALGLTAVLAVGMSAFSVAAAAVADEPESDLRQWST